MTMNRFHRVSELWNWLPGFRAVAEHQSVNEAGAALHISASSLSRTVKLLESALGADLFVRRGAGLELTQLGAELLSITRDVMRQVDDCIAREAERRGGTGPLYVGVASELAGVMVARALATTMNGVVHVVRVDVDSAADELLRGNLDLVVTEVVAHQDHLVVSPIGEVTFGVYTRSGRLDDAAFVAVTGMAEPTDREVVVRCESIDVAIALCERSAHACILPDAGWPSLVRVADARETATLYVRQRAPVPTGDDPRRASLVAGLVAATSRVVA